MSEQAPPIYLTQRRAWDRLFSWLFAPLDHETAEAEKEGMGSVPDDDRERGGSAA